MDYKLNHNKSIGFVVSRTICVFLLILLAIDVENQFIKCESSITSNQALEQSFNQTNSDHLINRSKLNHNQTTKISDHLLTNHLNCSTNNNCENRLFNRTDYKNTSSLNLTSLSSIASFKILSNISPNVSSNTPSNILTSNILTSNLLSSKLASNISNVTFNITSFNLSISNNSFVKSNQINRLINLNDVHNSSLNTAKKDRLNDVNNENNCTNSCTISRKEKKQMSFIDSISKLINLTNDSNENQTTTSATTTKIIFHRNESVPSILLSKKMKSSKLSDLTTQSSVTTMKMSNHKIIKKMEATPTPLSISKNLTDDQIMHKNETFSKINSQSTNSIDNLNHNQTLSTKETQKHFEKVLVYPVHPNNQSNDQSLSAQSKRAPHYLEEKFRMQILSTSTVSPNKNDRILDKPTPILDTKPLIEDIDSELNLRVLDERLINEELIHHHGSSSIEDGNSYSYEFGNSHHNLHHLNSHHSIKHEQIYRTNQTIDSSWFEQNCLKNCSCDFNGKWPEIYGQARKTLNCSNNQLNDYPVLTNESSRHVERLSLSDNNIKTLLINADSFRCERLIELDLSNNQLQQLITNPFNYYKHNQHPVVEFHPSHHHHQSIDENTNLKTISTTASNVNSSQLNVHLTTNSSRIDETTTQMSTKNVKSNATNKVHLFSHCHRLKILLLSGNDLGTLSTGCFRGLKRLRKLYLDNSQIRFIEKNTFLGANELRLLSLRFNELTILHSDMFQHMINLRVLDLTGNSLTYLDAGVFNSLVALQALHLGHNKIGQLSFQCFSGLDGLQLLTLDSNQLKNIPRFAMRPLKKLKILNMSGNPIIHLLEDDFSHSFIQLLLLNHLDQLQNVERFAFWDLPYLNELQISHCSEFVHLDEQAIVGAPVLHRLRLDHNAISQLDDRLLENLARMTIASRRQLKVYLSGNPFKCDCFLKPVYLCARDQAQCKIELPDRENITCIMETPSETNPTNIEHENNSTKTNRSDQIYRIDELINSQLPNECSPSFVSVITPINVTIVRRLRSKLILSCKAQGVPTPSVYWLAPNGEIHKEKLLTRHGHDLMESDLLTLPHSFQNDDTGEQQSAIEQTENQLLLTNQATAAFLLSNSLTLTLPTAAHHGSSTMRISHLTPNDAGLYTCISENRLGLIRSHVQVITQLLKIELEAEKQSTNYITVRWQLNSIFNPPLSEMLNNETENQNKSEITPSSTNSTDDQTIDLTSLKSNKTLLSKKPNSLLAKFNVDFDEAIINAKNEQNLNSLEYQLLYKSDPYGTDDENKQTSNSAETLNSERIFESNKFFASYESVQINRQLKSFTVAGLRPGTRYKLCIAVKEPRSITNELVDSFSTHSTGSLFRKRSIRRSFKRSKRNLISVESSTYLAIGCMHSETTHTAAFYARNILKVDKLSLPVLLSTAFNTAIKFSLICSISIIFLILFFSAYKWTKQHHRRLAYETPRKTLLSLAGCSHQINEINVTPYLTPRHQSTNNQQINQSLPMESIYSPLMLARRN